jgi:hypothetical protein
MLAARLAYVDYAIIVEPMNALLVLAESWLEGTD